MSRQYIPFPRSEGLTSRQAHADLPMAARTYGQGAVPTTFGAVVAAWGRPVLRHRILLNFQAESDRLSQDDILKKILEVKPAPKA